MVLTSKYSASMGKKRKVGDSTEVEIPFTMSKSGVAKVKVCF